MDIGIGLPAAIPGVDGGAVVEWARRAEERGFASVAVIDRLAWPGYEPLVALAAAAAATRRVRLATTILVAPLRANLALLAKQAATVDRLSGGRLLLGLAVGGREDDFQAAEVDARRRGRLFDEQLADLARRWRGDDQTVGPPPARPGGPRLLIGGHSPAAVRRTARWADGWIAGSGGVEPFARTAAAVRAAWSAAGRQGTPWLAALAYFALGPGARQAAVSYLGSYYGQSGAAAERVADRAVLDRPAVAGLAAAYAEAGCDELFLFPCLPDIRQVDLLAAAAL